jgi:hypothetical protein
LYKKIAGWVLVVGGLALVAHEVVQEFPWHAGVLAGVILAIIGGIVLTDEGSSGADF